MSYLVSAEKCTGCFACVVACPKGAITFTQDSLGNIYPEVHKELCIRCGKCQKVCPEQNLPLFHNPQKAFAVWSLDPESRRSSASGGAAAEFYAEALEKGYWICGAEYSTDGSVVHTLSRESTAIQRYKQSKYVYSEAHVVYRKIKQLLEQGDSVLIISLPCKVAGLLSYLGKHYDNLLTVDIVCHGTPSGLLLQQHISEVAHISDNFRLQFRQDNQFQFCVESDGKILYKRIGKEDTYLAAFLEGLSYRDSCYQCSYAKPQRISDITICDFWGIGQEVPFNHPYTGSISAVLLNTEKGSNFFESSKKKLFSEERPVTEAISGNAQLNAPTTVHPMREAFVKGCSKDGFERSVAFLLKDQIQAARWENKRNRMHTLFRQVARSVLKRHKG